MQRTLALSVTLVMSVNRVIMRWGLCTDLLEFNLQLRKTLVNLSSEIVDEGYVTSHCLNWGFHISNEIGRIVQHIRKGEGRKDGNILLVIDLRIIFFFLFPYEI